MGLSETRMGEYQRGLQKRSPDGLESDEESPEVYGHVFQAIHDIKESEH